MVEQLTRNWWAITLRGVLGIIVGLIALLMPGVTLAALILLFGAYAIVDGVFAVVAAVRASHTARRWWVLLIEGLASIAAGIITFAIPALTALVLIAVIAVWAIVTGVAEIAGAVRLRNEMKNEWLLGLAGVLSVVLGVLLILMPAAGLLAWVWVFGAYSLVFGITMLVLGFRLRGHAGPAHIGMQPTA